MSTEFFNREGVLVAVRFGRREGLALQLEVPREEWNSNRLVLDVCRNLLRVSDLEAECEVLELTPAVLNERARELEDLVSSWADNPNFDEVAQSVHDHSQDLRAQARSEARGNLRRV